MDIINLHSSLQIDEPIHYIQRVTGNNNKKENTKDKLYENNIVTVRQYCIKVIAYNKTIINIQVLKPTFSLLIFSGITIMHL